jgi:hypothetical protein
VLRRPLSNNPLSLVTVCAAASLLVQTTVEFKVTDNVAGVNAKLCINTSSLPDGDVLLDLEQPYNRFKIMNETANSIEIALDLSIPFFI